MASTPPAPRVEDISDRKLRRKLNDLCSSIRECQENISPWEIAKKTATDELKPILAEQNIERLRGDGWLIVRTVQHRKTLSPEKLIELGVPMEVIEKAYVTKVSDVLQVRGSSDGVEE